MVEAALAKSQSGGAKRQLKEKIKRDFAAQFSSKAKDKEGFHELLSRSFGKNFDRKKAEAFRQRALNNDFSWLPDIRFLTDAGMAGGSGAYDPISGTIYLNENLADQPELATSVFSEEVGHHLDRELNATDTPGDEGEMFRRLMSGEKLSKNEEQKIRAENDKGKINVDGKEVEVEFFVKKAFKKAKKGLKKVGKKLKDAGKGVVKGFKKALNKLAQNKWVGYALTAMQFIPATAAFATMANAALAAYRGIKNGDFVGAAMGAASAFTGGNGVVSKNR